MSRLNEVTALFYDTKSDVLDSIGNWQDYLTTARIIGIANTHS